MSHVLEHLVQWITDRWLYVTALAVIIFLFAKRLPIFRSRGDPQDLDFGNAELEVQLDSESEIVEISDLENIPRQDVIDMEEHHPHQHEPGGEGGDALPIVIGTVIVFLVLIIVGFVIFNH
jgi:hypothetical protein